MKRKSLLLLLTFVLVFVLACAVACQNTPEHQHDWSAWTISTEPTDKATGKAVRTCSGCDEKEEIDLAVLTDTSVWTYSVVTPATHSTDGEGKYTSEYGNVTVVLPKGEGAHNYSWVIGTKPSLENGGTVVGTCACGDVKTDNIAALSDTSVWAKVEAESNDADCENAGKGVYTSSAYNVKVEIVIDALGHDWDDWTMTSEPTKTEPGSATHTCKRCEHPETGTVPMLTDSVWSVEVKDADYNAPKTSTYTSVYGKVVLTEGNKLVAPFDSKTYHSINYKYDEAADKNKTLSPVTSWMAATLVLDANGTGIGTGYPFAYNHKIVLTVLDKDAGLIQIAEYKKISTEPVTPPEDWGEIDPDDPTLVAEAEEEVKYEETPDAVKTAYIDWTTGIIVLPSNTLASGVSIWVPSDSQLDSSKFSASNIGLATLIDYAYDAEHAMGIYITDDSIKFNVSFVAESFSNVNTTGKINPQPITAGQCYVSGVPQYVVVVRDKDGQNIAIYVQNLMGEGSEYVVADSAIGSYSYTDEATSKTYIAVLSGSGAIAVLEVGESGPSLYAGGSYTITGSVVGASMSVSSGDMPIYWELTLSGDGVSAAGGTFTYQAVNVEVKFNMNGVEIEQPDGMEVVDGVVTMPVPKYLSTELPSVVAIGAKEFAGWYLDAACTQPVELDADGCYTFNADVIMYAKWVDRLTVHMQDMQDGSSADLYIGVGVVLADKLMSEYNYTIGETVNSDGTKYFNGWAIVLANGTTTPLSEDYAMQASDTNVTVKAEWKDIPVYAGTYYGAELNALSWVGVRIYMRISNLGDITTDITKLYGSTVDMTGAKVHHYEDGKVYFTIGNSEDASNYFYFDEVTKTIAGMVASNKNLFDGSSGYYLLNASFEHTENYQPEQRYIIDTNGAQNTHVVAIDGRIVVLLYDDIVSDVSLSNVRGETLSVADLNTSKNVIIKKSDNSIMCAYGATGKDLASAVVQELDNLYGEYTISGSEELGSSLVLDGMGNIEGMDATYATVLDKNYLDVYVFEGAEDERKAVAYYRVTLSEGTATVVKPVATVSFVVKGFADGATAPTIADISVNLNIATALPVAPMVENYLFIGYFSDEACADESKCGETILIDTEDARTIYASYSNSVKINIVKNNGEEDTSVFVAIGSTYVVETPVYAKHALVGWFTTSDFQEGTEWVSGETVVSAEITIYAKWGDAPIYNQDYNVVELIIDKTDVVADKTKESKYSKVLSVNPYGVCTSGTISPFRSTLTISYADQATGKLNLVVSGNDRDAAEYVGFIDPTTGFVVMLQHSNTYNRDYLYFFSPYTITTGTSGNIKGYYWADGAGYVFEYSYTDSESPSHTMIVYVNTVDFAVYFDVALKNEQGSSIGINDVSNLTQMIVKQNDAVVATVRLQYTVTVVYGNGMDNGSFTVKAGLVPVMSAYVPAYKDGKMFDSWYSDPALTEKFVPAAMNDDLTVYCKWVDSIYGASDSSNNYHWTYNDGVWTSGSYYYANVTSVLTVTFYQAGHFEFDCVVNNGNYNYAYLKVTKNGTDITNDLFNTAKKYSSVVEHVALNADVNDVFVFTFTHSSNSGNDKYAQITNFVASAFEPVTITYNYNDGATADKVVSYTTWDTVQALEAVDFTNGNKVFAGWFTKDGAGDDWGDEYVTGGIILEPITLYAKWLDPATLTVVYATVGSSTVISAMENVTYVYPTGATIAPQVPGYTDGYAFSHWSEAADGAAIDWSVITSDKTIYAVWVEACALYGDYVGAEMYYCSDGEPFSGSTTMGKTLSVAADGTVTAGSEINNYKLTVMDGLDATNTYHIIADSANGVILYNYGSNYNYIHKDLYLFVRGAVGANCDKNETLTWGADGTGYSGLVRIDLANGTAMLIYFDNVNSKVYGNVKVEVDGTGTTYISSLRNNGVVFTIKDSAGTELGIFGYVGTKVLTRDAYFGTYYTSGTDNALMLNGFGALTVTNVTLGLTDATGTYKTAAADAGYTYDVVINKENYELTIYLDAKTYLLVKPMFTISFNVGDVGAAAIENQVVNKGAKFTMPEEPTSATHIFQGWYLTEDFSGSRQWYAFAVSADTVLYAKWAAKVTLTIHYDDGEPTVKEFTAGNTVVNSDIASDMFAKGKMLAGFYTDSEYQNAYVIGKIESNTEIWAKWYSIEGITLSGDSYTFAYAESEGNVTFVSNNGGKNSSTAKLVITATAACTVTFDYAGGSEARYDKLNVVTTGTGGGVKDASGADISGNVSIELKADQTITITYIKDGSGDKNGDQYTISNLVVTLLPNKVT